MVIKQDKTEMLQEITAYKTGILLRSATQLATQWASSMSLLNHKQWLLLKFHKKGVGNGHKI